MLMMSLCVSGDGELQAVTVWWLNYLPGLVSTVCVKEGRAAGMSVFRAFICKEALEATLKVNKTAHLRDTRQHIFL